MELNDLLNREGVDPNRVIVMRHRPREPGLMKVLPWLAAERPDLFNAYQATQGPKLERALEKLVDGGHVASFIAHGAGRALFVGLYSIDGARPLTFEEFWSIPAYEEFKKFGLIGWTKAETRGEVIWFDLVRTSFYEEWAGRLVIGWPPPERSWWRRAHRNSLPVLAIREESDLDATMPDWDQINLSWEELTVLPTRWRASLSEWRAIYFIFDASDGKGYVGSAYGESNLLGRWQQYAASGHGGNRLLRTRNPRDLRFTILQRVSPDMEATDVIRLEASWKDRLHTRQPFGLNDN